MTRQKLITVAKVAVSLLLIWGLFERVELAPVAVRLAKIGPLGVLVSLVPLVIQVLLAAFRWRLACRVLGVALRTADALNIVAIGLFFNQTLPSAVGGDAVRIWLLARDRVPFTKALSTVLSDRLLALVVLFALSAATLPLFYQRVDVPAARLTITVIALGGLAATALFLVIGSRIARLLRRWRFVRPFGEIADDFRRLFFSSSSTAVLVASSIGIHLLTVLAVWLIAESLGLQVDALDCLIIIPPVILIMTLPVSMAGWGVREGAMVFGLGMVGVPTSDALALSICWGLATIVVGLPGGILWLRSRRTPERPA